MPGFQIIQDKKHVQSIKKKVSPAWTSIASVLLRVGYVLKNVSYNFKLFFSISLFHKHSFKIRQRNHMHMSLKIKPFYKQYVKYIVQLTVVFDSLNSFRLDKHFAYRIPDKRRK